MRYSDELISVTGHQMRTDGKHQSTDRNDKEDEQRKDIAGEALDCNFTFVAHAQSDRHRDPRQYQNRSEIEEVEVHDSSDTVDRKFLNWKTKHEDSINFRVRCESLKMDPTKYQRKRQGKGQHSAPR